MASGTRRTKNKAHKSATTSPSTVPQINEEIVTTDAQTENVSGTTPMGSPASKRVKPVFTIISESLSTRFFDNQIGTRPIAPGKHISLKLLTACGAKDLIDAMGMRSFVVDMPKVYYPELVR